MVEYPHPQLRTPARSVSLLAIAWAMSALPAAAQGTAPSPEAAAPADTVADITVTARRHEETLQNVPLSITALSALDLENAGVKDLRDVAALTPGLTVSDQGGGYYTVPTIRGLSQLNTNNGLSENNVAVFLNGVYLANPGALNVSLLNLDRIEVVKGPQSALYGRSAFAGAINYVSKAPSSTLTGNLTGTIGSADRYAIAGTVSGPLTEHIRATIGGTYDTYGGTWSDPVNGNDAGDYKKRDVIASIQADLWPDATLTINGYYGKDHFGEPPENHLVNNCASIGGVFQQYCGKIPQADTVEVPNALSSGAGGNDRIMKHVDAKLSTPLGGGFSLDGIFGWNNIKSRQFLEINNRRDGLAYTLSPGPGTVNLNEFFGGDLRNEDFSGEVRLSSPQDKPLRFSTGGFAYRSKGNQITNVTLPNDAIPDGQTITNPIAVNWLTPGGAPTGLQGRSKTEASQVSAFAQAEYHLENGITIAQELRYTDEEKKVQQISNLFGGTIQPQEKRHFRYWNTRSTISYQPTDDLNIYGSVANGTKSGGFNLGATLDADKKYDPEKGWTYEVGAKASLFGGRMRVEGAVYHITWKNMQILGPGSDPANPSQFIKNYGAAKNTGFEVSTQTILTKGVKLGLGFAYNDAKFTKAFDAQYAGFCAAIPTCAVNLTTLNGQPVIDLRGKPVPRQSKLQFTSSLDATLPVNDDWNWFGVAHFTISSKQNYEPAGFSHWGPTPLASLRTGFENKTFKISAWVENLLNRKDAYMAYYNVRITDFVFETLPIYMEKRTFGVTGSVKF